MWSSLNLVRTPIFITFCLCSGLCPHVASSQLQISGAAKKDVGREGEFGFSFLDVMPRRHRQCAVVLITATAAVTPPRLAPPRRLSIQFIVGRVVCIAYSFHCEERPAHQTLT